ncbi:DUF2849 domain-containing protein [Nitratireductor basaltis]|uniref:Sulfite reductase n=1 Tax=Nitratireductor basaltis TaxID=472175 RepID=A0A084U620_9HYPH|nr:DUF2849 domain-containing protein [Nitratireductor basaltis]KFB08406.1 hypothetical protein EL18_02656 [Nitratireductor basaltis]
MKLLTANRLIDGEAVWLGEGDVWVETIDKAVVAYDKDDEVRLSAVGLMSLNNNVVVDVNLIDVELVDGAIRPIRLRERIRAEGPTTHLHFGKQARPQAAANG